MDDDGIKRIAIALIYKTLGYYDSCRLGGYNGKEARERKKQRLREIDQGFINSPLFGICCDSVNIQEKLVRDKFYETTLPLKSAQMEAAQF